jgi:hypothetical protein
MAVEVKKLVWESKTVWFNMLTILFGVANFFVVLPPDLLEGKVFPFVTMVWGTLGIILRLVTKDKVVLKD